MTAGPAAVVLAGGASRRFGSDKLAASLDGGSLLDLAVDGLPADATVLVVGPERGLRRAARFVREHPPGGGPAAALVTGLTEALRTDSDEFLVLPGDAPRAGHAAGTLLRVLRRSPGAPAVVGTDGAGFEQPLQLALWRRAAEQLVASGGADAAAGQSARALVRRLDPPALRWPLPTADHWDVDTAEQLRAWRARDSVQVLSVLAAVDALAITSRPAVVALDGRSGAEHSTLASALGLHRAATLVRVGHFCSVPQGPLHEPARSRSGETLAAEPVLDWRRLRSEALEPLLRGDRVVFAASGRGDDGRVSRPVELTPSALVVLAGVYSGRPELADLVDLSVLLEVPTDRRVPSSGLEDDYFVELRPPESFDLRVPGTLGA